ncbi:hypothetical protein DVK02_04555 [Halobellus sp. Atlit-31R]|nr:hypothetical protein DVK02_04555 [Halobellus sp. Atlit-31R]
MTEDDTGGQTDSTQLFELTRDKLLLAAILLVGVAGSGIARRLLAEAGYDNLGVLAFILGYGGMVVVVWYGWIRPMDLTGPE